MTDQERSVLLRAIAELCDRYPHWRLGQLVSNVAGWADLDIWDVEDTQLLAAAESHLEQLKCRDQRFRDDREVFVGWAPPTGLFYSEARWAVPRLTKILSSMHHFHLRYGPTRPAPARRPP